VATALARAGVDVVIGDLLEDPAIEKEAAKTLEEIEARGRRAIAVHCDVADPAGAPSLVEAALRQLGGLHLVCANAGVQSFVPVTELTLEEWEQVFRVNATGTFLTCKAALPHLIEQRAGAIVNIASITGLRASRTMAHYSASKFAVVGFTQALAAEVAEHRIRVNCVCPSSVRSAMTLGALMEKQGVAPEEADQVWTQVAARRLPLGASVEPEDIAEAALYLFRAEAVTGIALPVTGGEQLR
jgi:meso-butanediol dehydrogenase/(S,S)-butanediol dehydrogenase/diacetyl reductase